jgi:two-component system autoinducer 1 sensor kinase/phosphatase LuxN
MKNCLIIDDVEVSRFAVSLFLDEIGLNSLEAEDSETALEAIKANQIDVIILDWQLKNESGLELIKTLKAESGNCPVIILSGVEGQDRSMQAKSSGADYFLAKPATADNLEAALRAVRVL